MEKSNGSMVVLLDYLKLRIMRKIELTQKMQENRLIHEKNRIRNNNSELYENN